MFSLAGLSQTGSEADSDTKSLRHTLFCLIVVIERPVPYRQISLGFVLCVRNCLFFHLCRLYYSIVVPLVPDPSANADPNKNAQNLHLSVRPLLLHGRVNGSTRFRIIKSYGTWTFRVASSDTLAVDSRLRHSCVTRTKSAFRGTLFPSQGSPACWRIFRRISPAGCINAWKCWSFFLAVARTY